MDRSENCHKMNEISSELTLPYKFKAQELIAEGRVTEENVEKIRTFVSNLNDKYVPSRIQDEMIVIFLISCSQDIELTKKTILSYYLLKFEGPEIFDDRKVTNDDIILSTQIIHMSSIPVRTEENDVIHYFKLCDSDYRKFDLLACLKISYMLLDVAQEKNPPNGLIVLIDMKGSGLMHMTKMNMHLIKKYMMFLQEAFPMKLKMIHFINSVYFLDKILAFIKVFIKGEVMNLIQIHPPFSEPEKLFKVIPKKYLPKEYGGDLPSEEELHEVALEQFKSKQEFWDIEEKIRKQVYS